MQRKPEPELMDDEAQARAYAEADFSAAHDEFVRLYQETFPPPVDSTQVLDLGCGPADVTVRFANAFPGCRIHAVDGANTMLRLAQERVTRNDLQHRVTLAQTYLPTNTLARQSYDVVISNSLLHHLHNPSVLWSTIRNTATTGARIFVMDLRRPASIEAVHDLVARYAAGEPEVLRRDFFNSLLAAYQPAEVEAQLKDIGLPELQVSVVSDRHLTVRGTLSR